LLLSNPAAASNPFYELVPRWFLYPMIVIATLAAITASQALISGCFSLTRQAVQLGYCPRVTIRHTSAKEEGQIYVPEVNWALMVLCLACVIAFRTSAALTAAYGVAVTGTMAITTVLFGHVAYYRWRWPAWRVAATTGIFLIVDLSFFSANLVKFRDGGWFPLALATAVFALMTTWKAGRGLVTEATRSPMTLAEFLKSFGRSSVHRVPGVAMFMTSDAEGVPPTMLHHLKHSGALKETVMVFSALSAEVPTVPEDERVDCQALGQGFYRVVANYGFMESADIPALLPRLARYGLVVAPGQVSYMLGQETLLPTGKSGMAAWRKRLFILMARNAQSAASYFNLPPNRVVVMGAQIQI
jgi:KUP system potassium uptake protein